MFKFRDLTVIDITSDKMLVISCDSSGGIGNKNKDVVKVDPEILGYFTTKVALMEVLAIGAVPITLVNTLGVEMKETGEKIIKGIKKALEPLNLKEDILITGSTEENIPVCQTSMGITIIGTIEKSKWRQKSPKKGDLVVAVGLPKVGQEVLEHKSSEIVTIPLLLDLIKNPYINDIIPVGSKGIAYEINEMAKTSELNYNIYHNDNIDLYKSAGPATCIIAAIDNEKYNSLKESISIPINIVGVLY